MFQWQRRREVSSVTAFSLLYDPQQIGPESSTPVQFRLVGDTLVQTCPPYKYRYPINDYKSQLDKTNYFEW
jgi:hypothetical protein